MLRFIFKHQVSNIALAQFITMCFLGFANGAYSIASTCAQHDDCLSNAVVSVVYWILIAVWFGFLWVLSYTAQERRSKRLIWLLIGAQALVALISSYNARHHPDIIGLITSIVDFVLAVWVIILALRLLRAKGGRVVAKQRSGGGRARRRRTVK